MCGNIFHVLFSLECVCFYQGFLQHGGDTSLDREGQAGPHYGERVESVGATIFLAM